MSLPVIHVIARDRAMDQARRARSSKAASPAVTRSWVRFWVVLARHHNWSAIRAFRQLRE